MEFNPVDLIAFVAFLAAVVSISLYMSRKEESSEDYFLAGRGLSWPLIGFSLIASNISTEHFVGMAGAGFGPYGLAVASYEWIAAITLVVVALYFLPLFLRLGIYTMPEFLERRYGAPARTLMAVYMLAAYVGIAIASVLYSGALGLQTIFGMNLYTAIWLIGFIAGGYTIYGGLKAVVWSDLLQGGALILGGAAVSVIAIGEAGGLGEFLSRNSDKLHVVLPSDHSEIPWTALLLGIWIPNFFYWGFNQFITQRTLGAKSLAQGQIGIVFAAALKLLIPFIIVFPGVAAFQLYGSQLANGDQAYPTLIKNLLPAGLRGAMLAALFGAVMSSLDSMLNSASTIFTMDIYKRHLRPAADPRHIVKVGRTVTGVFALIGCLIAPLPANFEGVYNYIQLSWGFISPGIVAVFVFGLLFRRAPGSAAVAAMVAGVPVYGLLLWLWPEAAFLNHMAVTFIGLVVILAVVTARHPLSAPAELAATSKLDTAPSTLAGRWGVVVIAATVLLYVVFW